MAKDELFCIGQKAVIDKGSEVLVLFDMRGQLDMPGGKIKEGVTDFTAELKREVEEEANLEIEVGEPFSIGYFEEMDGKSKNFGKKVYLVFFKCRYISGEIKLSEEHSGYKWVNKNICKEFSSAGREDYRRALEKYFSKS